MVVYGLVTFGFIVQTIEALRPRTESRALVLEQARRETPEPLGLFMPHGRRPALAEELRRWRGATAGDVSAELATLNLAIAGMLERQVVALERVYRGLRVLLALAAAMLAFAGAMWWLRPPG